MATVGQVADYLNCSGNLVLTNIKNRNLPAKKTNKNSKGNKKAWDIKAKLNELKLIEIDNGKPGRNKKIITFIKKNEKKEPEKEPVKGLKCSKGDKCIWSSKSGERKYYCPFKGCISQ